MRKILVLTTLILSTTFIFAQNTERPFSIGIHSGLVDYHGDLNMKWLNSGAYRAHIGLTAMYSLNPWFNTGFLVNYGSIGYHKPIIGTQTQIGFRANMLHANVQLRLKFNNGSWLKEQSRFQPYIYLGVGVSEMMARTQSDGQILTKPGTDFTGNAGLGLTYKITDLIGVNYNLNYAYTDHSNRDNEKYNSKFNDQFMQHSLGLVFDFGKSKNSMTAKSDNEKKHLIGLLGGVSFTNAKQNGSVKREARRGIVAGISYEYLIKKYFSIGTDLKYEQRGFTEKLSLIYNIPLWDEDLKDQYNFNYISLPLKASFKFGNTLYGFANLGLVPALLSDAQAIYPMFNGSQDMPLDYKSRLNKFDLGLLFEIGAGYKIKEKYFIFIQLGYQNSITSSTNQNLFPTNKMFQSGVNGSLGFKYMLKSKTE